jgi:hypothetical protein
MSQDERDDEEARRARAARLRERIARLKSPDEGQAGGEAGDDSATQSPRGGTPAEESPAESPKSESPRDFIHRRMRELDKDKQGE